MPELDKILHMVQAGRLTAEDSYKLLTTLILKFSLRLEQWEKYVLLFKEQQLSVSDVEAIIDKHSLPARSTAKKTSRELRFQDFMGNSFYFGPQRSSAQIKPKLLKVETQWANGGSLNTNIPISLAKYAVKLLPKQVVQALDLAGVDIHSLPEVLTGDLPTGVLMELYTADGSHVLLSIE